ncbi:translation initiation factor IF3-4, chloroplastic isoform X2 [Brassica napus]|uniref:translation initiation factor IF-3 isoform X2 n=1 Tax=Brassica oleracea var. oleracea TaxID=109376 RepID=UPI0006A6B2E4|nr:PREDICTED: translation initiation factor IF-3 isoform X2 [Brassica oleracea var. oleracea]XP_048612340.1 translation initiation factor IF3-4, chloroplastic isoform X2 [Brassica napus]
MAGITSTVGFNAVFAGITKTLPFSVSSIDSKLYGLRLSTAELPIPSSPRRGLAVTCRYGGGGGGGYRFSGDSRRGRPKEAEVDEALDIASIRSATVRLIDGQQNMLGLVSKDEAVRRAEDAELDLVCVTNIPLQCFFTCGALASWCVRFQVILSPDADPPVVKMMDYSKYRYEQQKKKKDQQKKTTRMDLKELKMGYNIDQHDYSVRMKAAQKFLQDGDKVKVIVSMKGRENEFRNIAIELLRRFQTEVGELATEESKNFRDRNLFIILVPNKEMIKKPQEPSSRKKKKIAAENEVLPAENEVSAAENEVSAAEITTPP